MIKTEELLDLSRIIYKSPDMSLCELKKLLDYHQEEDPEIRKMFLNLWHSSKFRVWGKLYKYAVDGAIKSRNNNPLKKVEGYAESVTFVILSTFSALCLLPQYETLSRRSWL